MSTTRYELESAAGEALGKLTVLPAGSMISVSLVAAVCGCSLDEATYLVRVLLFAERLQVARRPGTRTDDPLYALTTSGQATHDAIRPDRSDILRCWTDWLLVHASRAEAILTPERPALSRTYRRLRPASLHSETEALAWLYSHRRDLIAAVHTADDRDWPEVRWQLTDAMWPLLKRSDQRDTSISVHREHGVPAARVSRDPAVLHRMLTNLGAALRGAGEPEEALAVLGEAAAGARQHERQRDQADALTGIAELHLEIGEYEAAAAAATTALELRTAVGDRHGCSLTRVLVGDIASHQGQHESAIGHLERARRDLLAERDTLAAARALETLGAAHGRAGRPRHR
ncbi:tetratricopeptide repeat protein [Streptomyces sp. G-5]|uniref:tetratricopeptide repeat protein n=1 Tax=Streptomyces sp. G-5 TaxID=2977231 RepID=UPI0021D08746|nr:tetratricopeptide repeat protein [Streptomyces sp. G-5]MCU4750238.1 hypothetical protein [Streptomyces sp. G-5]